MMEPQDGQPQAPTPAPPQVVHVEGLGFVLIPEGQTLEQAVEAKRTGTSRRQADPSSVGFRGGTPEQFVGVAAPDPGWMDALPPELRQAIEGAIRAMPQLASIATDLAPQTRVPKAALGLTVPPLMQMLTNLGEGKPWSEGVAEEAGLGALGTGPRILGSAAAGRATKRARQALATSPRIGQLTVEHGKDFVEEALPMRALESRARATKDGVAKVVDRAAEMTGDAKNLKWEARNLGKEADDLLKGVPNPTAGERALQESTRTLALSTADRARQAGDAAGLEHALGNTLEDLRFSDAMRGPSGGPSAIAPGSGAVTTAVRSLGLNPGIGQVAAPAAGWFKGSPVRKLHAASRMYSPFGVNSEEFGEILSNVLRARYAGEQATGVDPMEALAELLTPAVSHTPRRRKP